MRLNLAASEPVSQRKVSGAARAGRGNQIFRKGGRRRSVRGMQFVTPPQIPPIRSAMNHSERIAAALRHVCESVVISDVLLPASLPVRCPFAVRFRCRGTSARLGAHSARRNHTLGMIMITPARQ